MVTSQFLFIITYMLLLYSLNLDGILEPNRITYITNINSRSSQSIEWRTQTNRVVVQYTTAAQLDRTVKHIGLYYNINELKRRAPITAYQNTLNFKSNIRYNTLNSQHSNNNVIHKNNIKLKSTSIDGYSGSPFTELPWPVTQDDPPVFDASLTNFEETSPNSKRFGEPQRRRIILEDDVTSIPRDALPIPPDAFILNFGGTIQWSSREIIRTATLAAINLWPHLNGLCCWSTENTMEVPFWLSERIKHVRNMIRNYGDLLIAIRYFVETMHELQRETGYSIDVYCAEQRRRMESQLKNCNNIYSLLYEFCDDGETLKLKDLKRGERGYPKFPWLVNKFQNWDNANPFKKHLYYTYGIRDEEGTLEEVFFEARMKWQTKDFDGWSDAASFRTDCSDLSGEEQVHHKGHTLAAIDVINHNLQVYGSPMYIYSTTEKEETIRMLLKLFGVSYNETTASLLNIYGIDTPIPHFKHTSTEDIHSQRTADILQDISMKVNSGKQRFPIHVVDDDINVLSFIAGTPTFEDSRLYFAEWGFSSYQDKERAHLNDKIKVFRSSNRLVPLCCLPSDMWGRKWSHGYSSKQPMWHPDRFMHQWAAAHGWYK